MRDAVMLDGADAREAGGCALKDGREGRHDADVVQVADAHEAFGELRLHAFGAGAGADPDRALQFCGASRLRTGAINAATRASAVSAVRSLGRNGADTAARFRNAMMQGFDGSRSVVRPGLRRRCKNCRISRSLPAISATAP
ncbi:hypothetical protein [Pseudogemmobacter humi]|uniref:hypothetical protein n=1 Tax=Pseudogemmobacter humi TaxID=2483812 RepID=UPI000F521487|nr:hypothetical protein [Pseudogemmobacter humi]